MTDLASSLDLIAQKVTQFRTDLARPITRPSTRKSMPYEFSVLPIMVLGNINEQFLGKVIPLTPSQPSPFNLYQKNPNLLSSFHDAVR